MLQKKNKTKTKTCGILVSFLLRESEYRAVHFSSQDDVWLLNLTIWLVFIILC